MEEVMLQKTRYFNQLINFMQVRMKEKCQTKFAKVDVLKIMWDHRLVQWFNTAIGLKDDGMKVLIQRCLKIKPDLKNYVLSKFLNQCRKKHTIAFIEWRLHYSSMRLENNHSAQMEKSEIEELIHDRLDLLKKDYQTSVKQFKINN